MNILILWFAALLTFSCSSEGKENGDPDGVTDMSDGATDTSDGATDMSDGATDMSDGATDTNDDTGSLWGQLIDAPAETFFARDLSEDVRSNLIEGLRAAAAEWGNYGPVEYWVAGTNEDALEDLVERYCERRFELHQTQSQSECVREQLDPNGNYNLYFYYDIALRGGGSAGGKGINRQWEVHVIMASYPSGFDSPDPIREMKTIFHEYIHIVHHSFIQTTDEPTRQELLGPKWFRDGIAEFMADYALRVQLQHGEIDFDGTALNTIEEDYIDKLRSGMNTLNNQCSNEEHALDCDEARYDVGAWAVVYLFQEIDDPNALLQDFLSNLEQKGWDTSFADTFGRSEDAFTVEFQGFWENQSQLEKLQILPDL